MTKQTKQLKKPNQYLQAKEDYKVKIGKLFEDLGIFWAFGNSQLEEGLNKLNLTTDQIISIGGGGFMPKANVQAYKEGNARLSTEYVDAIKKCDPTQVIEYELGNFESYYSGSISEVVNLFADFNDERFNRENILKVYQSTKEKHENL